MCRAVEYHMDMWYGSDGVCLHVRMNAIVIKWFGESENKMFQLFFALRNQALHVDGIIMIVN